MSNMRLILEGDISVWIFRQVDDKLSGRALACAVNARNFLVRAEKIATVSPIVSYFCASHATEEAVASFVSACKVAGYAGAKEINLHDHKQKATVSAYAQLISGHAQTLGLNIAREPKDDVLVARLMGENGPNYHLLSMSLFTFNRDSQSRDHAEAFERFAEHFPDAKAMYKHILQRSDFRNQAIYASDHGAPSMSEEMLQVQLRDHALLTLGLVWGAVDVLRHDRHEPFVLQVLGAINEVTRQLGKGA